MASKSPCTVCGEACKSASRCKALGIPPEGFFTGGDGGGGHGGDDEDESLTTSNVAATPLEQTDSVDGESQSMPTEMAWEFHDSPNRPSNGVV